MSSCQRWQKVKRSMQRKSGFHLVSGRTSNTFLQIRLLCNVGHVLHQRYQCFMLSPSPFLPAKERAEHEQFGKRTQRPHMHSCFSNGPGVLDESCLELLGRFVVLLCDKTSRMMKADEARQHQFFKRSRGLEIIPPTQAALSSIFCVQRTNFSGLRIWENALKRSKDFRIPQHGDGKETDI